MTITISQATDLGMPSEMLDVCKQLLERRIRKTMTSVPEAGTEVTILYSDKDPLGTSGVVDDEAYFIYFDVVKAEGESLENSNVTLALVG